MKKKAEIIAIGNELLSGMTSNSNGAFIAKALQEKGYELQRQTILPDSPKELKKGLKEALKRSSFVIATGGLGPTCDDFTKKVASSLFESPLVHSEKVAQDLRQRFRDLSALEEQSQVPEKAFLLKNTIGTAPGFVFSSPMIGTLILLPGVPAEMKEMLVKEALAYLLSHFPPIKKKIQEKIRLFFLPEVAVDPFLRQIQEKDPKVKIGIYPSYGTLQVTLSYTGEKEEKSHKKLQALKELFEQEFADYIFEGESLEKNLHELLLAKKKTIAFAESCTGGALSAHITALPGSSAYFLGSIISYSNEVKKRLLGVQEETLQTKGAVSQETVEEMIQGVFRTFNPDYAIALSGIAGPSGGTKEKPVGTVFIAVAGRGEKIDSGSIIASGDRARIITCSVNSALGILLKRIAKQKFFFE